MPNYLKHYQQLCNTRKLLDRSRNDDCYYEEHHILPKSESHKQAIRDARLRATPRTLESRIKSRESALVRESRESNFKGNHTKITCPHCSITGQTNAMLRWHFNNCKEVSNA